MGEAGAISADRGMPCDGSSEPCGQVFAMADGRQQWASFLLPGAHMLLVVEKSEEVRAQVAGSGGLGLPLPRYPVLDALPLGIESGDREVERSVDRPCSHPVNLVQALPAQAL